MIPLLKIKVDTLLLSILQFYVVARGFEREPFLSCENMPQYQSRIRLYYTPVGALCCKCVRPDMRYCSRSRRFHPDPGTKHISIPPRHMTSHMPRISNMISQHYSYMDTTSHTI